MGHFDLRSTVVPSTIAWVITLLSVCLSGSALASDWELITKEYGVVVDKKDVAGRDLPTFRGRIELKGSLYDTLTVLDDTPGRTQWVHRCIESRLVRKVSDFKRYVYNRTKALWPVTDRDVVVLTRIKVDLKKHTVRIDFRASTGIAPKVDGAIRIPDLEGFYFLEALGENKTRVTYQLDLDPGGWLPNWLIKLTSKKIPLMTLRNLQTQVTKVSRRGNAAARQAKWHKRLQNETGQVVTKPSGAAVATPSAVATPAGGGKPAPVTSPAP